MNQKQILSNDPFVRYESMTQKNQAVLKTDYNGSNLSLWAWGKNLQKSNGNTTKPTQIRGGYFDKKLNRLANQIKGGIY